MRRLRLTPHDLAREIGVDAKRIRQFLRETFQRPPEEHNTRWDVTSEQADAVRRHFGVPRDTAPGPGAATGSSSGQQSARDTSDEAYVVDLCDEVLGERATRQHGFDWLTGDPNASGRRRMLLVDAYYPRHALVVEYRERQHDGAIPFFNRRSTVSGVDRGQQRRIYDERREQEIPRHGLQLVVITPADLEHNSRGRLRRTNPEVDLENIRWLLGTP